MLQTLRTLGLLRPLSAAALLLLAVALGFWALGLAVPLEPDFEAFVSEASAFLLDFNLVLDGVLLALCLVVLGLSYKLPWGAALQALVQGLLVWGAWRVYGLVEALAAGPVVI